MSEKKKELTEEEMKKASGGALSGGAGVGHHGSPRPILRPGDSDAAQENPRDRQGEDPTSPAGGGLSAGDTGPTRG